MKNIILAAAVAQGLLKTVIVQGLKGSWRNWQNFQSIRQARFLRSSEKRWLQHFGGLKINIFNRDVLYNFSFVSVAYIITFSVTVGFIFPLQQLLLSNVPAYIGLFFLPHGVRILTLYFYGWRGMFYLLPASLLMSILSENITGLVLFSPIVSLLCCYLGVQFVRILFSDTVSVSFAIKDWKILFWGGVVGSIFNGFGLTFLNQTYKSTVDNSAFLLEVIGFAVGDVLGLIFCLLSIVYLFRMIRFIKIIPDK